MRISRKSNKLSFCHDLSEKKHGRVREIGRDLAEEGVLGRINCFSLEHSESDRYGTHDLGRAPFRYEARPKKVKCLITKRTDIHSSNKSNHCTSKNRNMSTDSCSRGTSSRGYCSCTTRSLRATRKCCLGYDHGLSLSFYLWRSSF